MSVPSLLSVTSEHSALLVKWSNNPYLGIDSAYLLVAHENTNTLQFIYLTEAEAIHESYTISGLNDGDTYYVSYSQIQNTPDNIPGPMSNTLSGVPSTVPPAPKIKDIKFSTEYGGTKADVLVDIAQIRGAPVERVVFQLNQSSGDTNSVQTFTFISGAADQTEYTYQLINLTPDMTYLVACNSVNDAGYSRLSNTYNYTNTAGVPKAPTINYVKSGMNQQVSFDITVTKTSEDNTVKTITFYYQLVNSAAGTAIQYFTYTLTPEQQNSESVNIQITTTDATSGSVVSLSNGSNYRFYAIATGATGAAGSAPLLSPPSNYAYGVPANLNTISDAALTVNRGLEPTYTPSGLTANWTNSLSTGATYANSTSIISKYTYYVNDSGAPATTDGVTVWSDYSNTQNINNLNPDSKCNVDLFCRTVIPPVNRPYWTGLSEDGIIKGISISATVIVQTVPKEVTHIDAFSGLTASGTGSIQVTWKGNEGDTNYSLALYNTNPFVPSPPPQPYFIPSTNPPIVNEYYTFTNLPTNTEYWVSITAINNVGAGPANIYPDIGNSGISINGVSIPTPTIAPDQTKPGYIVLEVTLPALSSSIYPISNATLLYSFSDLYYYYEDGSSQLLTTYTPSQINNSQNSKFTYTYSYQAEHPKTYTFGAKSKVSGTDTGGQHIYYESMVGITSVTYTTDPLITNYSVVNNAITFDLNLHGNVVSGIQNMCIPSSSSASAQIVSVSAPVLANINLKKFIEQKVSISGPPGLPFSHAVTFIATTTGKTAIGNNICDS